MWRGSTVDVGSTAEELTGGVQQQNEDKLNMAGDL